MAATPKSIGRNIHYVIDKDVLTITIPVGKNSLQAAPPSKSMKTKVFATTSGNQVITLPDGTTAKLGVNAYFDVPTA